VTFSIPTLAEQTNYACKSVFTEPGLVKTTLPRLRIFLRFSLLARVLLGKEATGVTT